MSMGTTLPKDTKINFFMVRMVGEDPNPAFFIIPPRYPNGLSNKPQIVKLVVSDKECPFSICDRYSLQLVMCYLSLVIYLPILYT